MNVAPFISQIEVAPLSFCQRMSDRPSPLKSSADSERPKRRTKPDGSSATPCAVAPNGLNDVNRSGTASSFNPVGSAVAKLSAEAWEYPKRPRQSLNSFADSSGRVTAHAVAVACLTQD